MGLGERDGQDGELENGLAPTRVADEQGTNIQGGPRVLQEKGGGTLYLDDAMHWPAGC